MQWKPCGRGADTGYSYSHYHVCKSDKQEIAEGDDRNAQGDYRCDAPRRQYGVKCAMIMHLTYNRQMLIEMTRIDKSDQTS